MFEAASTPEARLESADRLGFRDEDRSVVYDRLHAESVHQEFLLYEHRADGRTVVERFHTAGRWESPAERTVLDAMHRSRTTLYRVSGIDPEARRVELDDRFGPAADLTVTDLGLSVTAEPGQLVFCRRLPLEPVAMTSGLLFAFHGRHEDHLQSVYDRVTDRVTSRPTSVTRFVVFHKLHRKYGIEVRLDNLELPGDGAAGPDSP
jgi:hypothetical protein